MNIIYRILNLFVLLIFGLFVQAQDNNVIEHIKLNTDRDLYFNGEDIFFTANYFINNEKSYPVLSKIIYIELIESINNKPIIQKKYKIDNFNVNGNIRIPINVTSGSYLLRAYTQYQRNFSAANYSYCYLTILNPNSSLQQQAISSETDSIYIATEGNTLLDGIKNNIIIKIPKSIVNENNQYTIRDETGMVINELKPHISGFIQTEMSLQKSKQYKLEIIKSTGDSLIKALPKIQSTGIQTRVKLTASNVYYKIQTIGIKKENENLNFQIKIFSKDFNIKHHEEISFKESFFDKILSTNLFNNGINYIVLTDMEGNIKKVNSIFKSQIKAKEINIGIKKDHFKTSEKIEAFIQAENEIQKYPPVVSVSVTRNGTIKEDHDFIPFLYFNNPIALENYLNSNIQIDDEIRNQIMILYDNTLNTELFIAKNNQSKDVEFIPEIRDHTITGILRNKDTKKPVPNHNVYLSVLFNNPQIHVNRTNENGEFIFSLNNVYGKNDIFLCSESYSEEENMHEILIRSSFSSNYLPVNPATFIDNNDADLIQELYINAQIQQKFNKRKGDTLIKSNQLHSFNIIENKTIIIPDNYITMETMQELFFEIVPYVIIKKNKNKFVFNILGENENMLTGNPLIILDHIPIFNTKSIMELDPSKIKKIEVINRPYILGSHTFNGIILLTSNIDNFSNIELPKSATFLKYQFLEIPVSNLNLVEDSSTSLDRIPDFRTTLYWNPQFKLTNEGQPFNFNASDRKGTYNIIIEGYNSDGQAFYGKKQITIE